MRMRLTLAASAIAALWAFAGAAPALAQTVPTEPDQVAQPGGDLPGDPKIALVKIADGFNDPVSATSAGDGSGRIFVVERVGRVKIVNKDGSINEEPFLDLTQNTPLGSEVQTGFVEQGMWSIAFHPDFKENGYFFVSYSSLPFNGAHIIARYTVDPENPDVVNTARANETVKVIMNIPQPYYNHYGGGIHFGPDGYLYIGKGDAGWEGDPLNAGQDLQELWGKMLRIDVNTPEDVPYSIPKTNPYYGANDPRMMSLFGITEEGFSKLHIGARAEIWAYGLRNPYSFSFDPKTGSLFIADVGQNHYEEIDWQPADSKGGQNYGWKFNMGTQCHPSTGPDDTCPIVGTLPVSEYPHQTPYPGADSLKEGWGCSVIALGVANYAGMEGVFLSGDWCSGRVFGTGWDGKKWQIQELAQTSLQFTGGGLDDDGNVLAVNCNCFYTDDKGALENPPGSLWRIVAADNVPEGAETAKTRN
ncbi:MAG: PQQ-dependent sugar dehydrogenase [Methyloligella sp. ZOD6]